MAKQPWFKMFPSDFLGGTRGMTPAQVGIYTVLLMTMYESGVPVPRDDAKLARLCGCQAGTMTRVLDALIADGKLEVIDGALWNRRVDVEVTLRSERHKNASVAATIRHESGREKVVSNQCDRSNSASQNGCGIDATRARSQKPEARSQKERDVSNETSIGERGENGGDLFGGGQPDIAHAKAKAPRSKRAKLSTDYTPEFLEFWAAYPKNARMSKAKAFEQFSELTPEDRRKAIVAAPLYAAQVARLRTPEDKIKFAHNWLAERYFDALTDPELRAATERHALVVASSGGGRATFDDRMNGLAQWVAEKENGRR